MLAVSGSSVVNGVLLASAIVPPVVVVLLAWFFLRAGRRHDERDHAEQPPAERAPDPVRR